MNLQSSSQCLIYTNNSINSPHPKSSPIIFRIHSGIKQSSTPFSSANPSYHQPSNLSSLNLSTNSQSSNRQSSSQTCSSLHLIQSSICSNDSSSSSPTHALSSIISTSQSVSNSSAFSPTKKFLANPVCNSRSRFRRFSFSISHLLLFISFFICFFISSTRCQNDVDLLCTSPNFVFSRDPSRGQEVTQGQVHFDAGFRGQSSKDDSSYEPSWKSTYEHFQRKWKKMKVFDVAKNGTVNLCHNVDVRKIIQVS